MGGFYLNPEQRLAVETIGQPVLVMAPVGTGKTHVLTERTARLLDSGIAPEQILCLSFTNKAAREIRDRLTVRFGRPAQAITAKTFHGLCAQILRAECEALGVDGDFLIYDEEDCAEIFSRISARRGITIRREDQDAWHFLLTRAASLARLSKYDEAQPRGPKRIFEEALLASNLGRPDLAARVDFRSWLEEYLHELRENHALDFTDLVRLVLDLMDHHPSAFQTWARRFSTIHVDEVQDTSRSEYRILAALAEAHGQLSLFGDIDQAIYEWRGSAPFEIIDDYKRRFAPVEIRLRRNYRSTKAILAACHRVIRAAAGAVTTELVAEAQGEGEPADLREIATPGEEGRWIARTIQRLHDEEGASYSQCAVLTRTNFSAREISRVFEEAGVPHLRVDQFKFFQRAEIKAAAAHLRLLMNPGDGLAARRFLDVPPKGIGEATVGKLSQAPREAGLRISDLLRVSTFEDGEPYARLMEALGGGRAVVFDTETTGRDTGRDEIVEIAAARCGWEGIRQEYHAWITPACCVGSSEAVHGYSDEFLARHGRPERDVLREFLAFCGDAVLAGHNLAGFDMPILEARLAVNGMSLPDKLRCFDTLDISRRLFRLPGYRLADLAASLCLQSEPSHKAADDVRATVELLLLLAARLKEGACVRAEAVSKLGERFRHHARLIESWREASFRLRPYELLEGLLEDSGIRRHFAGSPDGERRLSHLRELGALFERLDTPELPPRLALLEALNSAALGTDLDRHAGEADLVPVLTVHQAKGLEFDNVFVANATDSEFPSWRSLREGRLAEEHRLFYVAISRARRRLSITWPAVNGRGRPTSPSRFLVLLE